MSSNSPWLFQILLISDSRGRRRNYWKMVCSRIRSKMVRRHFNGLLKGFPELTSKLEMENLNMPSEQSSTLPSPQLSILQLRSGQMWRGSSLVLPQSNPCWSEMAHLLRPGQISSQGAPAAATLNRICSFRLLLDLPLSTQQGAARQEDSCTLWSLLLHLHKSFSCFLFHWLALRLHHVLCASISTRNSPFLIVCFCFKPNKRK